MLGRGEAKLIVVANGSIKRGSRLRHEAQATTSFGVLLLYHQAKLA